MRNRTSLSLVCLVLAVGTTLHAETAYVRTIHTPTLPIAFKQKAIRLQYGTLKRFDSTDSQQAYFSFSVGTLTTNDGEQAFKHKVGLNSELSIIPIKEFTELRRALTKAKVVAKQWADGQPFEDDTSTQQIAVTLGEGLNLRLTRSPGAETVFLLFTGLEGQQEYSILTDSSNFLVIGTSEDFIRLTTELIERIDASIKHLRRVYPQIGKQWNWEYLLK